MTKDKIEKLIEYIGAAQSDAIVSQEILSGEYVVTVKLTSLHQFIDFLKTDEQCFVELTYPQQQLQNHLIF